jgi:single-stranded DNA-binding protein
MPTSVNKVILVGNVGKKTLRSGIHRAALRSPNSASLPTKGSKDRHDEWQDRTEWHSVVA